MDISKLDGASGWRVSSCPTMAVGDAGEVAECSGRTDLRGPKVHEVPIDLVSRAKAVNQAPSIFRPVQYLGSKLRVIDQISTIALESISPGSSVVDLFAGSTVVSQAFARSGFATTAVDTQAYAVAFAEALLGIGRKGSERIDAESLIGAAISSSRREADVWWRLEIIEADALSARDAGALRKLYRDLPLAWRTGSSLADASNPLTSFFSGSYFGIAQALHLDALARSITSTLGSSAKRWQLAAARTALMHAASLTVHSAGKHFAQPLKERSENAEFLNKRLLSDRSISVPEAFRSACAAINQMPADQVGRHCAFQDGAEQFAANSPTPYSLYYLDPPYTAQQYSRFYHVLEAIATDALPSLPPGSVPTSGLYPPDRFKSAFSSRKRAPAAFRRILQSAAEARAVAMISYSASAAGSNGNARMILLDELLSECERAFGSGRVEMVELDHRYRQFNSGGNANQGRDDREVLVLCRPA